MSFHGKAFETPAGTVLEPPVPLKAPKVMTHPSRLVVQRLRTHTATPISCLADPQDNVAPPVALSWRTFGEVAAARFAGVGHFVETEREEADRAPAGLMIDVVSAGCYSFAQDGKRADVHAGEAIISVNRLPFRAGGRCTVGTNSLMVPAETLSRELGDITRLAATVLPARTASLGLLGAYMRSLQLDEAKDDPAARAMMGRHLVDLLVAAVNNAVGTPKSDPAADLRFARLALVRRLIDSQIDQPTLSVTRVARHFGVTERSIQKLFEAAGGTYSSYVMEKRLTLARERLADPRFAHVSARAVADSVGFTDAAHFSRAFRRRFGETPGGLRGTGNS